MNFGFYGHTNTMVFTFTKDGKYEKRAFFGGMRQIYESGRRSMETTEFINEPVFTGNLDSNEYRKDYFAVRRYETTDKKAYYGIGESLGYEDGDIPNNIFSVLPDNPDDSIDMLFVWDEGYGGLSLPSSKYVFWASDKALPDKELLDKIANGCFLFLDGNVLRNAGAMISRQISWERTASELISELQNNPEINYLLNATHLMISFGLDGAVFISPKGRDGNIEASLILTHGETEGTIDNRYPAKIENIFIFSMMSILFVTNIINISVAADAGIISKPKWDSGDIVAVVLDMLIEAASQSEEQRHTVANTKHAESNAVKWGGLLRHILEAAETTFQLSWLSEEGDDIQAILPGSVDVNLRGWPAFNIPLMQHNNSFLVPSDWTITNSMGKKISEIENITIAELVGRTIPDVALEYVQIGATAIEGLPQLSLGALTTVDRWEIESYQNIRNLILDYANGESMRPLSIAVFGSPGSGKSFGVTEIAKNILPGKIEKLEFNVSQFTSLSDLGVAFQKVRDTILGGKLPLVFFDEFDSDRDGLSLGWVKSFLMPMQDGKFRDDSGEHPLGRCILVFAGGTATAFEEFIKQDEAFKNIKGPDFISRLRGTINVFGPNKKDSDDINYILRRALLLRSLCERDRRLNFDKGIAPVSTSIVRAMLHVPEYKHGARSMEAILDMSRIEDNYWKPNSLPSSSQLALHVDADAFINLVLNKMEDTTQ